MAIIPSDVGAAGFKHVIKRDNSWRANATDEDFVVESWSEGFMVAALIIMGCITVANMRKKVLLHKLILGEQLLAMMHGTFCFMAYPGYGWYLSSTATLLYCSYFLHNVIAWLKVRPFFSDSPSLFGAKTSKWVGRIYIGTLLMTIPILILQIYDNFCFFNNKNELYARVRPYEPLVRDPWWVLSCLALFHVIRKCYSTTAFQLVKISPRFGILLLAIILAMAFTICDIVASISNFTSSTTGVNPWWKLALVFKCLTDTIMLDDFKTELRRIGMKQIGNNEGFLGSALRNEDQNEKRSVQEIETVQPRQSNPEPIDISDYDRSWDHKRVVGRTGTKISPLPSIAD